MPEQTTPPVIVTPPPNPPCPVDGSTLAAVGAACAIASPAALGQFSNAFVFGDSLSDAVDGPLFMAVWQAIQGAAR